MLQCTCTCVHAVGHLHRIRTWIGSLNYGQMSPYLDFTVSVAEASFDRKLRTSSFFHYVFPVLPITISERTLGTKKSLYKFSH